jgi:hypothetical protein
MVQGARSGNCAYRLNIVNMRRLKMKVTVQYQIYVVKDSFKNTCAVVTDEPSNDVQVCGMKNKESESLYFESEAHHIEQWCRENKLDLRVFHRNETVEI